MSTVTDYAPLIGRAILTPADFITSWGPTATNQTSVANMSVLNDAPADISNATQCKYFLNNILSLSTSDPFGAVAHFASLSTLCTSIDSQISSAFTDLVTHCTNAGKFTLANTTKYDTIQTGITAIKNNFTTLKSSVDSLKTSITATYNGLAANVPTVNSYNAARTSYTIVIGGLAFISNRLHTAIGTLNDFSAVIINFKICVNEYLDPDVGQDVPSYMTAMNYQMSSFLYYCSYLYVKIYLFKRLRGDMF